MNTQDMQELLRLLRLEEAWLAAKTPGQRGKVEKKALSQIWATPDPFVRGIEALLGRRFAVDLCAQPHTSKAPLHFGPGSPVLIDALEDIGADPLLWRRSLAVAGLRIEDVMCWANVPFLRKAEWSCAIRRCSLPVVLEVPPSTDQPWFGSLMEDPYAFLTVIEGRLEHEPPEGTEASTPNGGTVLWAVGWPERRLPARVRKSDVIAYGLGEKEPPE